MCIISERVSVTVNLRYWSCRCKPEETFKVEWKIGYNIISCGDLIGMKTALFSPSGRQKDRLIGIRTISPKRWVWNLALYSKNSVLVLLVNVLLNEFLVSLMETSFCAGADFCMSRRGVLFVYNGGRFERFTSDVAEQIVCRQFK